MISKEEFTKIINEVEEAYSCENDFLDVCRQYVEKGVLYEYMSPGTAFLAGTVLDLLAKLMGFPADEDIISYWCWEGDFGKDVAGKIEDTRWPENHIYRKPNLDTVDKLYDYCVFLAEEYNK